MLPALESSLKDQHRLGGRPLHVSYSYNSPGGYPHYYTGAFMSPGYPARSEDNSLYSQFDMYFGGQPSYTYTTITLLSSPSLLSGSLLRIHTRSAPGRPFPGGFSEESPSPISIFTGDTSFIRVFGWKRDSTALRAAFLFSFEGRILYSGKLSNYKQCCTLINTFSA